MTTECEAVHAANPDVAATRCGLPFAADLRLSPKRSSITCPACLTAMGEPRVISGLDAVAATPEFHDDGRGMLCDCSHPPRHARDAAPPPPAKPTRVEVGQRWRFRGVEYVVVKGPREDGEWATRWDRDPKLLWFEPGSILRDEYLGTVPAPVSAPGQSTPVLTWPDHGGNSFDLVQGDSSKRPTFGNVPRQSTHVETPPTEDICHMCGAATTACACCRECNGEGGFLPEGACGGCDYCPTTRRCGACRGTGRDPNAPAPGAGEGPLSMGFAEACEVLVAERGKVQYLFGGEWKDWDAPFSTAACLSPVMVVQLSNHKWRIKPEPLPAPAPRATPAEGLEDRLTHLREDGWMVAVHSDYRQDGKLHTFWLLTRNGVAVKGEGETDAEALDRAWAAMLEPKS